MAPPIDTEPFPDGVTSRPLHPEVIEVREARRRRAEREGARQVSRRGLAGALDFAAAAVAALVATPIATLLFDLPPEQRPLAALAAALLVDVGLPMRPGRRRGQTAGKQIVGLRTRRVDGEPLGAGRMLQLSMLRLLWQSLRVWAYRSYDRATDTEVVDARNPPPARPLRGAEAATFDGPRVARATSPSVDSATRTTSSRSDR